MELLVRRMDEDSAHVVLSWRYEPPYDMYNADEDTREQDVTFLADPQNHYYAILGRAGKIVAFCCFGSDARVPGGSYSAELLDIGMGVRPDLTGQGHGAVYAQRVLDFGRRTFAPLGFRVTVAAFNGRALRVWERVGFERVEVFGRESDGQRFVVLERVA